MTDEAISRRDRWAARAQVDGPLAPTCGRARGPRHTNAKVQEIFPKGIDKLATSVIFILSALYFPLLCDSRLDCNQCGVWEESEESGSGAICLVDNESHCSSKGQQRTSDFLEVEMCPWVAVVTHAPVNAWSFP
ncbi:hypothetical protein EVAR_30844_1 [Eumeta japonica]|uniref:Uncharacterized protein n=1 Tax=Eumeta variegata TaxID=151549 RepID=A0A4C1XPE3_EUMVA|nr:hypothetical protein EVAR_30844_1 [Eumeta japonica]